MKINYVTYAVPGQVVEAASEPELIAAAVLAERQACARAVCPRCAADVERRYVKNSGGWIHVYAPDPDRYWERCDADPIWERGRAIESEPETQTEARGCAGAEVDL